MFPTYSLITVQRSAGLKFSPDGISEIPENTSDPDRFFESRLLLPNSMGYPRVATPITNNPHCSDWPWVWERIAPRANYDWFTTTERSIGDEASFMWEQPGDGMTVLGKEQWALGEIVKAKLIEPHINHGDWIVSYQKPPAPYMPAGTDGTWITRVVNERQMW